MISNAFVTIALLLVNSLYVLAQATGTDTSKIQENPNVFKQILLDAKHVFSSPLRFDSGDWLALGTVVVTTGAIGLADSEIRTFVRDNRTRKTRGLARIVEPLGRKSATAAIAGGFYLVGTLNKNETTKRTGIMSLEASYMALMITDLIKRATARGRPFLNNGPADFGNPFRGAHYQDTFPSGHTTSAFAIASVISSQYSNRLVDITAYSLAGLVGLSRIHDDQHWASDVFLGAAIGTAVGRTIAKLHKGRNPNGIFDVTPLLNSNLKGVKVSKTF